jgi:hypothetical protein
LRNKKAAGKRFLEWPALRVTAALAQANYEAGQVTNHVTNDASQRHHHQDIDVSGIENDDPLRQFRHARVEDDLVEILARREQVHPAVFHDPDDLKIATRRD